MTRPTQGRRWPLGHRDAHGAAVEISEPMKKWPEAHAKFRTMLSGRLVGATDKDDLLARLAEVSAEFRETLPDEEATP